MGVHGVRTGGPAFLQETNGEWIRSWEDCGVDGGVVRVNKETICFEPNSRISEIDSIVTFRGYYF